MKIPAIKLSEFSYELPQHKIPQYPLSKRDESKLLIYRHGDITEDIFKHITDYIDAETLLLFNNTRVFPARLIFHKATGARIEILCLHPRHADKHYAEWICMVGNVKKWKDNETLELHTDQDTGILLKANLKQRFGDKSLIAFTWNGPENFYEMMESIGKTPLPPYINREAEEKDKTRYQTIYADQKGSVAAPTAGLHFSPEVWENIKKQNIVPAFITLHVSAGTFKPVQTEDVTQHEMHEEPFIINKQLIKQLRNYSKIYCVGTTSLRNLESIYIIGKNILEGRHDPFTIEQWQGFENSNYTTREVLAAIDDYLTKNQLNEISGKTRLMIVPGYKFRFCKGLITNFHMPQSTLLMLIAAFAGTDWRKIYDYALQHQFRFLSYGDSSLLIP